MPHHPYHDLVVAKRRQEVATRYLRGELQVVIAHEMHVTQGTISRDLKAIHDFWMENAVGDVMAKKARESAKIDANEQRYLAGWERSLRPRIVVQRDIDIPPEAPDSPEAFLASLAAANEDEGPLIQEAKKRGRPRKQPMEPGASREKITTRREEQAGDPRFLDGMNECVKLRCALWGLNAATKLKIDDWDSLTDEQLERLAAGEPPQQVMAEA